MTNKTKIILTFIGLKLLELATLAGLIFIFVFLYPAFGILGMKVLVGIYVVLALLATIFAAFVVVFSIAFVVLAAGVVLEMWIKENWEWAKRIVEKNIDS